MTETALTSNSGSAARKPRLKQIGAAVLLAGAIPIALGVLLRSLFDAVGIGSLPLGLDALVYAVYWFVVFVFHLVPLPFGFWAGLAWPGTHLWGHTLLGLSAGLVEVIFGWAISSHLVDSAGPLAPIDYVVALGTVSLFIAGGLFGDLIERILGWRRLRDLRYIPQLWRQRTLEYGHRIVGHDLATVESTEQAPYNTTGSRTDEPPEHTMARRDTKKADPTTRVSDGAAGPRTGEFSPRQVVLIQAMVPGTFALTGTIINVLSTRLG